MPAAPSDDADVRVRLLHPRLEGGGRLVITFGRRAGTVEITDATTGERVVILGGEVLAPTVIAVEGANGAHVPPESVAALRDLPLRALVDSARVYARAWAQDHNTAPLADDLDAAIARAIAAREAHGGASVQFLDAFEVAEQLIQRVNPANPTRALAERFGVARTTVQRWAVAVRSRRGGKA